MNIDNATYIISYTNALLVNSQRRGSEYLAPRKVWRQLGRKVNSGETPIRVLEAVLGTCRRSIALQTGPYRELISLRSVEVFELSQTTGREFPTLPTCERKEDFANEHELLLIHVSGALTIFAA